ncbi:MAG: cell division protein FtsZ [Treponema sp.]|jgi:cell division protein FtsZ|nr:cell division protein FtsZ [Treponema sp.]
MNVLSVDEKTNVTQSHVIRFKPQEAQTTALREVQIEENWQEPVPAVIKVISAGGGGANALNRMIEKELSGVEFIAVNTDIQDLRNKSKAKVKVQIGAKVTGGRGAGGVPEKGRKAAIEDREAIAEALKGADMVFITAGMGGGTGTGSAPEIAKIAREQGALTIAVVTTPFEFEGRYKMRLAEEGIANLREEVDTLIVIPNQYLFKIIDNTTSWNNAYLMADNVLCQGVQGISELITKTGFQNTDFADVETVMKGKGDALMGIGFGTGENRAVEAVKNAIDNPLLEDTSIDGATGVLINIAGPDNITLVEIQNIIKSIKEKCDPEVHLIHGLRIDPELDGCIQVTVIATGFSEAKYTESKPVAAAKTADSDFIDYNEYVGMIERTKRPEYLSYLPQREYQDDLDVPSVIRNYNFQTEEKHMETAEKC